ncbi:shikimate dehydrogenase [Roseibium sp.]|uniref:shikimate dehydrogenase n=1 Tax=Roseibium sp. TaxID=1936156 RepID=UPI003A981607
MSWGGSGLGGSRDALLAGLVGKGIQKSRTPEMHMAEAEAQGMRAIYTLIDAEAFESAVPDLGDLVRAAELAGFNGLNITYPYKIEILPLLDELSDNARAVGSVNTVVFRDGKRFGHNTDLWGFAEGFRRGMDGVAKGNVLLIGAGGAGVAVAHALADCGVLHLKIFDSDTQRAQALADQVQANRAGVTAVAVSAIGDAVAKDLDGVVNATPVGMAKSPGTPFPAELLRPEMWVADIVYFPLETQFLANARAIGCRVLPGSGMALFQAVRAFELFTGRPADPVRMKATFDAFDTPSQNTAKA